VAALEKLPFVKGIKIVEDKYSIAVENAGKNLQELLCLAGEVEFVEVRSPDLNDVFLFYTGRQMREAGEESGFMQDAMRIT